MQRGAEGAEGAERRRRRRKAQKGTDVNSPPVITLVAKEALEGGHQGKNSKIAEH